MLLKKQRGEVLTKKEREPSVATPIRKEKLLLMLGIKRRREEKRGGTLLRINVNITKSPV